MAASQRNPPSQRNLPCQRYPPSQRYPPTTSNVSVLISTQRAGQSICYRPNGVDLLQAASDAKLSDAKLSDAKLSDAKRREDGSKPAHIQNQSKTIQKHVFKANPPNPWGLVSEN